MANFLLDGNMYYGHIKFLQLKDKYSEEKITGQPYNLSINKKIVFISCHINETSSILSFFMTFKDKYTNLKAFNPQKGHLSIWSKYVILTFE